MLFMLSKCRHIYVVMHTRILGGGGACVTMTQMKTKNKQFNCIAVLKDAQINSNWCNE